MLHKQTKWLRRICVVTFANDFIQHLSTHMWANRFPHSVVISDAEMIAGNYFTAIYRGKILNTSYLFYYQLLLGNQFFKELCACLVGYAIFDFIY